MSLRRASLGVLVLAAVLTAGAALQAAKTDRQIRSTQKDLDQIKKELSRKESEKEQAERKAKELKEEVERISLEIETARRSLKGVQGRLRETEKKRRSMEERLWSSRLGIGQWEDLLALELKRYYERRMVEGVAQAVELAYRRAALEDKMTGLQFALDHHAEVEGLRDRLVELEIELQKLRLQKEEEEGRFKSAQHRMRTLYNTVQGRRAVLEKDIRDLQSSAKKLEKMIQSLIAQYEAERKAATAQQKKVEKAKSAPIARQKQGRLPWPIEGTVVERYGR
ncbi:MAG: hypothetical protein HY548_10340, partial [Elusimicrobia bacterium]|nr:hypothetical protein [Elusimicrobiota bacterium]